MMKEHILGLECAALGARHSVADTEAVIVRHALEADEGVCNHNKRHCKEWLRYEGGGGWVCGSRGTQRRGSL